jgi:HlyD family secretion protein
VEVNTENTDNLLLPYLTAKVHFIVKKEADALLVPNAALRWSPTLLAQVAPDSPGSFKPSTHDNKPGDPPGVVWVKDGEFVRAVEVKTGITDGVNTAVTTDGLREGQEVVTGESSEMAQAATLNPFLPPIRRR